MTLIKQLVEIDAPPVRVFEAIATPAGLAQWWTEETSGSGDPGGVLEFRFGERYLHRMQVVDRQPDRRVEWVCLEGDLEPPWVGTRQVFELQPKAGGTTLRFEHTGWAEEDDGVAFCNQQWSRLLAGLRELCETGAPSRARWRVRREGGSRRG